MVDHCMTFSNTLAQRGRRDFLRELTEFILNCILAAYTNQGMNAVISAIAAQRLRDR